MKVALLRCHGLRKYEMQSFEPLRDIIEIKAFSPCKHTYDLSEISLPIEKLPPVSKFRQSLRDIKNLLRGREGRLYKKADFFLPQFEERLRSYDIIHVNEIASKSSYVGAMVKKKYGMKLIATVWENIPFFDRTDEISRFIFKIAYPCIDFFITPTERGKEVLKLEGVPEEKIRVIYHGIEVERFSPCPPDEGLKKSLGIAPEDKVMLFAGRIVYKKGIYALCQAVKEIKRVNPGIRLKTIMIGKGPEQEKLKQYIKDLKLEKDIVLYGHIPYKNLAQFYNLCHIFVLPSIPTDSWQEQFGFVLTEAMAAGKPIITTRTGAIPEVVGDGAILIPPDDYQSLAKSMMRLLNDENLCISLGEKARQIVIAKYDIQKASREFLSLYENILSL
jgi:glycosyltransferase involved in cell wall biosynthesis